MNRTDEQAFRFYDNRQKYLMFVNTCDEKWRVAEAAARHLETLTPRPPGIRIFDAGVGDGTVLAHLLSATHAKFPTIPIHVVGKEISLEDVRLTLGSLADRFAEHPQLVVTLTNLHYSEAPDLVPNSEAKRNQLVFETHRLTGSSAYGFGDQLRSLDEFIESHWAVRTSEKTGNPLYVRPTVLTIHRDDQTIALDNVIPCDEGSHDGYDFVLASQPWRSRTSAEFKAKRILGPLARALRPGGTLLVVQSSGDDPGTEIIDRIWPGEEPFPVDRFALLDALRREMADEAGCFVFDPLSDDDSRIVYSLHALPNDPNATIGTPSLLAAWNAAVYVGQIEDARVEAASADGSALEIVREVVNAHDGLWFNDESFVVRRIDTSK